jgi:lysophospholipase L1-like esterase
MGVRPWRMPRRWRRWLVSSIAVTAGVVIATGGVASAVPARVRSYVALGDSYTAGPLIPQQLADPPGCQRSDHNYPHLLAAVLRPAVFRDASCFGATTFDMTAPQFHDIAFGPPNPAQFDGLDASTELVTVQIGGNDIGFTQILVTCALSAPCRNQFVVNGHDEISDRIAATGPQIGAVLDGIHRRSPRAKVYVMGYPAIVPATGTGCPAILFSNSDIPYLFAKGQELNAMLHLEAAAQGSVYVDMYTPSIGHDPCQPPGVRWVEPILGATGEVLHPNATGMSGMASVLLATLRHHHLAHHHRPQRPKPRHDD